MTREEGLRIMKCEPPKDRKVLTFKERRSLASKVQYLKRYGLTIDSLADMVEKQSNRCAICGSVFTITPRVDHCHSTGKVRGLLCNNCNLMIGLCNDCIPTLSKAIDYLNKYK